MERKSIISEQEPKKIDSEKDVERRLVIGVEKRGGMCIKMLCYQYSGLPDRLVLMKGLPPVFIETKTTGKKPRRIQTIVHNRIMAQGIEVKVIDTLDGVNEFLYECDAKREELARISKGDR